MDVCAKVVTLVKTGAQTYRNYIKNLDSGLRRNDELSFVTFCKTIGYGLCAFWRASSIIASISARKTARSLSSCTFL